MTKISKKSIQKAGLILTDTLASQKEHSEALETLFDWRSLHQIPVSALNDHLDQLVSSLNLKDAIIAQRFKRTPSIISKLKRNPAMPLSRMQDIGGMRVIVKTIEDVYRLYRALSNSESALTLLPPKDYILRPKASGYRSLHQVFKFKGGQHEECDGLLIELQIRTQLQHAWATAVETLGSIEKVSFKAGAGSEEFKRFFILSSALFSTEEKKPLVELLSKYSPEVIAQEMIALDKKLHITNTLRGITLSGQLIEKTDTQTDGYHLLELNTHQKTLSMTDFSTKPIKEAQCMYNAREIETRDNDDVDVVLISAGTLKTIKKAYPNYFLEANHFIESLDQIGEKILGGESGF